MFYQLSYVAKNLQVEDKKQITLHTAKCATSNLDTTTTTPNKQPKIKQKRNYIEEYTTRNQGLDVLIFYGAQKNNKTN